MKRAKLGLLVGSPPAITWAAAQKAGMGEQTFFQMQIEAAFDTCRELAQEAAELRERFPMTFGLDDAPFDQRLETCVLSVLRGDEVIATPLG